MGVYTFGDILEELKKPGRDPREKFVAPQFRDEVKEISDLQPGMTLEGVVTNVTNFGAFVDIGVHQDGLVHISELSDRYVKDPNDAVKVGQIVKVHVLNADAKAKRIALSMKTQGAPPPRTRPEAPRPSQQNRPPQSQSRPQPKPQPKPEPKPQQSMDDKIAQLANRWKNR